MEILTATRHFFDETFKKEEYSDCFFVEADFDKSNQLKVFVDSDSGMTLQKCRNLSKSLESFLEETEKLSLVHSIEISSPGIDRPLLFHRQYLKNIGRELDIELQDGSKESGLLKVVSDLYIVLYSKVKIKEGKKNILKEKEIEFPFEMIKKAIVKIKF